MKEKICLLGVVLALVFVCSTAQAVNYYVSTTGNDAGSGTVGDPWASPSRGAGVYLRGGGSVGSTELEVNDTQGFLPAGNISLNGTTYAYTSKTDTSFILASPLTSPESHVNAYGPIWDADILGGNGFGWADVINLRGGTYSDQMIRHVGPYLNLTYQSFPGETARLEMTDLFLSGPRPHNAPAVVYNDGGDAAHYNENFTIKDLEIFESHTDNSWFVDGMSFSYGYRVNIDNVDVTVTGPESAGIKIYKTFGSSITNSVIYAKDGPAVRLYQGQWGAPALNLSYSVLGGPTVSAGPYGTHVAIQESIGGGDGIAGDHLTIVGFESAAVNEESFPNSASSTAWLTNSIIVDNAGEGGTVEALLSGGGDYNNLWNNAGGNYGTDWNSPQGAGSNDLAIDPAFFISGFSEQDPNRSDASWLRYHTSSALATGGEGGTYLGAFEPIPEPATLTLLVISGIGAALLRRRR